MVDADAGSAPGAGRLVTAFGKLDRAGPVVNLGETMVMRPAPDA